MTTNEGVGKKIVEALKKQNTDVEYGPELIEVTEEQDNFTYAEPKTQEDAFNSLYGEPLRTKPVVEDSQFEIKEQPVYEEPVIKEPAPEPVVFERPQPQAQPQGWNFAPSRDYQEFNTQPEFTIDETKRTEFMPKQFDMPPNVSVLKRLISQLPSGVTKQTGAQIIKQTMEALGISMNTVLHEAQKVQDDMNESIKNCMLSIQEYKNNIRNLEKQGLDYQRQVNQLNDLISLFILSDKD